MPTEPQKYESLHERCRRVWVCKRCGNCLDHCNHKDESNFHEDLAMPCSVKLPQDKLPQGGQSAKDLVVEARELLAKITPGKWGYDLNGHVAVVEDDKEWGQTLFLIPGKTTPQMTSEDHANGELFARAPELLRQLCDEVERLRRQMKQMAQDAHNDYGSY